MIAYVIPISSDSSENSVGSHVPRVILFGAISAIIPVILVVPVEVPIVPADPLVAPEVGAVSVTSPTGVLDLVDYSSSSDSDPSEDSLPLAPELPLVSPFLCSDDSEADSESKPAEQRLERHESLTVHYAMVSRWRDRRHVSHRSLDHHSSPDFTSDSSSSGSSLDSSSDTSSGSPSDSLSDTSSVHSSGCDASGQSHQDHRLELHHLESSIDSSSKRSITPTYADLLPPHKRFRDSYSPKDSRERRMEIDTADAEAITDLGISDGVGVNTEDGICMGVEIAASDIREDEEEFETAQRQL
ncbi:hypothetical protein Tco_1242409 [Tanacetum coccineum]